MCVITTCMLSGIVFPCSTTLSHWDCYCGSVLFCIFRCPHLQNVFNLWHNLAIAVDDLRLTDNAICTLHCRRATTEPRFSHKIYIIETQNRGTFMRNIGSSRNIRRNKHISAQKTIRQKARKTSPIWLQFTDSTEHLIVQREVGWLMWPGTTRICRGSNRC